MPGKLSRIAGMGAQPGKISKGLNQTGRHGGKLVKVADSGGHKAQTKTPVQTDRGSFSIKG